MGAPRTEPPRSPPWLPGGRRTEGQTDGWTGGQVPRPRGVGRPPRVGTKISCLEIQAWILSNQPAGPPPPACARPGVGCPGSSLLSARRQAGQREIQLGNGRAGAHLGSGATALPRSLRGAENCGHAPCKARPPRKKSRDPFCTRSAQGSEETKASEARSDLGLAGQGVEPGRLPHGEQRTRE